MDFRWAYKSAVTVFTDLAYRIPGDRWDGPGLNDWTVRDLVGHTVSSALHQVPGTLATPAPAVTVDSAAAYWTLTRSAPPETPEATTDDARQTGKALGDTPATVVAEFARRATQALSAAGDADIIATPVGSMLVRDWIATRTFTLVIHGLDLAAATNTPVEYATEVIADATIQAATIAAATPANIDVLRALTGRAPLPPGFSIT